MADIEKVIKGVFEMLQRNTWKDIDTERHRFQPVLNDALALLKEHEAVEPIRINTNYEQHWKCGNCKAVISVQDKYCHECGKRIEWEGR